MNSSAKFEYCFVVTFYSDLRVHMKESVTARQSCFKAQRKRNLGKNKPRHT